MLFIAIPNLACLYARIELLIGLQPHILEISNKKSNYGMGLLGKLNNPNGEPLHHIRGITYKAMKEILIDNGFAIKRCLGYQKITGKLLRKFPGISTIVLYQCIKVRDI